MKTIDIKEEFRPSMCLSLFCPIRQCFLAGVGCFLGCSGNQRKRCKLFREKMPESLYGIGLKDILIPTSEAYKEALDLAEDVVSVEKSVKKREKYTEDFKKECVLKIEDGESISKVSKEANITYAILKSWCAKADVEAVPRKKVKSGSLFD